MSNFNWRTYVSRPNYKGGLLSESGDYEYIKRVLATKGNTAGVNRTYLAPDTYIPVNPDGVQINMTQPVKIELIDTWNRLWDTEWSAFPRFSLKKLKD